MVPDTIPISTNDEVWETADEAPRFHKQVLAFLRDHPSQAYRSRELADKLVESSFLADEEHDRLKIELTDEEYTNRQRSNELPGGDNFSRLKNHIRLQYIHAALNRLRSEGYIETREVAAEVFDLPHDETAVVYTYAGDADYEEF